MDTDVAHRVSINYAKLSANEQRIADYVLSHARELTFASASQVARLLEVSASTVVRFAQRLGFEGYVELQERLQRDFVEGTRLVNIPVDRADLLGHIIEQDRQNLASLHSQAEALQRAAASLAGARQVFVTGSRASAHLAGLATHMLNLIRPGVWQLEASGGQLPERLLDMSSEDVLLAISMSRYTRDTTEFTAYAARTIPTVVVTDEHASPLRALGDIVVTVSTTPAAMFRSLTAAVMTVQALLAATAREIGTEEVQNRLERADRLWHDFGTFHARPSGREES